MSPPHSADKHALIRRLEQRILTGPGMALPELRARAFENRDLSEPVSTLLDKVATRSFHLSDSDFAAVLAAGFSEDQVFELVICAAVGQSSRLYQAALAAVEEATR